MQKRKYKLVMSGSGTRYPVFVGAMRCLEHYGYEPSDLVVVSGSALIGGGKAKGLDSRGLEELCYETLPSNYLDKRWLHEYISDPYKGIYRGDKLLKMFEKVFPATFEECKVNLNVVTYNISRRKKVIWNSSTKAEFNNIPRILRASMSLPTIFDSVMINGEYYEDGGIGSNFPIDYFGDDKEVIGLRFQGPSPNGEYTKYTNKIERAFALIEDMIESTTKEHIEDAVFARICTLKTRHSGLNFDMTKVDVADMIREGYESVDRWLQTRG